MHFWLCLRCYISVHAFTGNRTRDLLLIYFKKYQERKYFLSRNAIKIARASSNTNLLCISGNASAQVHISPSGNKDMFTKSLNELFWVNRGLNESAKSDCTSTSGQIVQSFDCLLTDPFSELHLHHWFCVILETHEDWAAFSKSKVKFAADLSC